MKKYVLTVFDKTGKNLLDEKFEAQNDEEAKAICERRLAKENYSNYSHRCVTSDAKLLIFKS